LEEIGGDDGFFKLETGNIIRKFNKAIGFETVGKEEATHSM
jgi:hypothetical protein